MIPEPIVNTLVCESCGKPITMFYVSNQPEFTRVLHTGCDKPVVSMITHNPRKLGIVTSIGK